ncbi:MAG TPA: tetratricopeptide repeat protein [Bacteroidales bacterium]|nr:tetratricopeptide repeat protein [Bacteroidales bacterium]
MRKMIGTVLLASLLPGLNLVAQDLKSAIRLAKSEQFEAATGLYKKLLKNSPNDGSIYYYYGDSYIWKYFSDTLVNSLKEMTDSAKIIFEMGIKADPANPLNLVGIGKTDLLLHNQKKAEESFAKANSLLPSKANKNIVMAPEMHAAVLIQMANAYVEAKVADTAKIFSLLRSAEKLDHNNYELYLTLGDAYILLLNDGSKAIANYNIAQTLNPTSPMAKLRVAQLWLRARNYKDALTYYLEVIKIDSTFAPAYKELGFLMSKANRNEDAKKYFAKFLSLSTGNTAARIQYVNTLIEIKDYQEAINQLNEVMKVDTSNNDLNRAMAYSYFELGQYDKGLYYIKKFFSRVPQDKIRSMDLAYYGRLLSKNRMDSLAGLTLLKAYAADTSRPELLSEAAMAYIHMKKYDRAIYCYQYKIDQHKAVPGDYYNMGKVYYNLQEWEKVDSTLAIYNQLQPDHVQGYQWRARALVNLDPETDKGLAKPIYEMMIEKALVDTVKYSKELVEAYEYLSYYYLKQFNITKEQENGRKSIEYCQKILVLDPENEKAKAILKELGPKIRQ